MVDMVVEHLVVVEVRCGLPDNFMFLTGRYGRTLWIQQVDEFYDLMLCGDQFESVP